ncbi:MAG: hypothetical protein JJU33_10845 [Phycisphaerales bacterium]|nr:hypothetical protein [Phycisphaerales bacterium]
MNKQICIAALAIAAAAGSSLGSQIPFHVYNAPGPLPGLSLWVEVQEVSASTVAFTFGNASTNGAISTKIYFETPRDGSVLFDGSGGISAQSAGVSFENGGSGPENPPGGSGVNWNGTDSHYFRTKQGGVSNGIGAGQWLTIELGLAQGVSYADILADLTSGNFRIAQHVQSIQPDGISVGVITEGGNGSEITLIPLPTGAGLAGLGLGLVALRRRR